MTGDSIQTKPSDWHGFEVGHGTDTLQVWRDKVLGVLESKYCVADRTEYVANLREHYKGYMGEEKEN